MDREWGGGVVTLDLEVGPMQVNLQDERTLGWFLLAFPRGHLLGRRLDGLGLDTLSLDVDKVGPGQRIAPQSCTCSAATLQPGHAVPGGGPGGARPAHPRAGQPSLSCLWLLRVWSAASSPLPVGALVTAAVTMLRLQHSQIMHRPEADACPTHDPRPACSAATLQPGADASGLLLRQGSSSRSSALQDTPV